MPRILWIEDDYYHLQGLVRGLLKEGFEVVTAYSGLESTEMLKEWQAYDLIIVDLILPTSETSESGSVAGLGAERFVGMGLLKHMMQDLRVTIPVIVLSVVIDPDVWAEIESLGVKAILPKGGLLPPEVQQAVHAALEEPE
jgi:CheY-like chemotaxis protein